MSSVVINNRMIGNQRIREIDIAKVNLPFNVSKNQVQKVIDLLSKISVSLEVDYDKLEIKSMSFNGLSLKGKRDIQDSNFTLQNTYVATIKSSIVTKVKAFYDKVKTIEHPQRPIINIGEETNLQQALREATAEIPLEEINKSLNNVNAVNNIPNPNPQTTVPNLEQQMPQQFNNPGFVNNGQVQAPVQNSINNVPEPEPKTDVVIANSPYEENNIKMNSAVLPNNNDNNAQFVNNNAQVNNGMNNQPMNNPIPQNQGIVNPMPNNSQNNMPNGVMTNGMMPQNDNVVPQTMPYQENLPMQPNVKVKKLSGKVFTIPIVIIWLGLVLVGSIKLVTSILT